MASSTRNVEHAGIGGLLERERPVGLGDDLSARPHRHACRPRRNRDRMIGAGYLDRLAIHRFSPTLFWGRAFRAGIPGCHRHHVGSTKGECHAPEAEIRVFLDARTRLCCILPAPEHSPRRRRRSPRSTAWWSRPSTWRREAGVDVLKHGGNAVDAAVAVGYALAVVYPAAGNLGGGGFMTIQLADGRKTFLDFREKAPLAATPDMYLDTDGNVVKGLRTTRLSRRRRAGHRVRARDGAREVRHDEARGADRARPSACARAGLRARPGRCRHARHRDRGLPQGPGLGADLPQQGPAVRGRRAAGAEGPRPHACGAIAEQGADGFYKGPVGATRSSRRARPARAASSRRPTSSSTRRASSSPSNATTAATTSSRRRRRARAA